MSGTDELIAKALAAAPGGPMRLVEARQTDTHLIGHAFKYAEKSGGIQGVYAFELTYDDPAGARHVSPVMLKAKPSEDEILTVYAGLLAKGDVPFTGDVRAALKVSDYSTPNFKEAVLFDRFWDDLHPYLPPSMGVYLDTAHGYALRLEARLPEGSVFLDPDDDTTTHWREGFSDLVLRAIADIHGRFRGRTDNLAQTGYFWTCTSDTMLRAQDLWAALLSFMEAKCASVLGDRGPRHRAILDSLVTWYAEVDAQLKTLLYGDVNPQNIAFAATGDGFEVSLFDWERATLSLGERDLAEHLIYTLPNGFAETEARAAIATYREALPEAGPDEAFVARLRWSLQDLILNRLPLMLLVNEVAGKRRHAGTAYVNAHRLLDML